MNDYYAHVARSRWQRLAPQRTARIEDPDEFFATLGVEIASMASAAYEHFLADTEPSLDNLAEVGRHRAARKCAEEYAFAQIAWPTPELTETEEREEWESNRPSLDGLEEWAWRHDGEPDPQSVEDKATTFCLTFDFVWDLAVSENPSQFIAQNHSVIEQAVEAMWARHRLGAHCDD